MRCLVLAVLTVTLLVAHAHPIERDDQTNLEESFADTADKKDEVRMNDDVQEEQTGEKKNLISTNTEEEAPESEDEAAEDKENDVTEDDVTKKDDVKPPAATKETKEKRDKKVQEKSSAKAAKKHDPSAKKWWMVEGGHKWGGMGHSHWGPPHQTETETEHHDEGHFDGPEGEKGERKGKVGHASCCKSKNKNAKKRCACAHVVDEKKNSKVKGHENGYHFHDKGGARSHNNDHDNELRGPWTFGYDGFGDDWGDWDHNNGNYHHLKDLEHESHGGHHEEVNAHEHEADNAAKGEDCGSKRDCVVGAPPAVVAAADDDDVN